MNVCLLGEKNNFFVILIFGFHNLWNKRDAYDFIVFLLDICVQVAASVLQVET